MKRLQFTASDTGIRPQFALTRDGSVIDLTAASLIGVQFSRVVPSGQTGLVASYQATIAASCAPSQGIIEVRGFTASPLATSGKWLAQVEIRNANGVEALAPAFTVMVRKRF